MTSLLFPHGICECPSASSQCCAGRGPAALEVRRGNRTLKLCTHCDLTSDTVLRILPSKDELDVYERFDPLGALCLVMKIRDRDHKETLQ